MDRAVRRHRPAVNVYFHTFGCKANQYDTERVRQAFADAGATVVEAAENAELAVVNSCTVTEESESKLRRYVRRQARAGRDTIVMGCAAALDRGALASLPRVRAVVGGAAPTEVLAAAGVPVSAIDPVLRRFSGGARGWLKIQDGCDEHCTFCATTIARGANRSRPVPEIVAEARALAEHHAELVLTGVHIGTYGKDKDVVGGQWSEASSLGELLEALVSAVPQVRFRLSSIEATEVDDRIARLLVEAPRNLAAHLHAPLQSGSNRVLKRMGRHWYTAESYRARIEWLAARLSIFGLGADVIAGFPGETSEDHAATCALVRELPFTYLHVFPFSTRPDAAAARLSDQHSAATIRARAAELRTLGEERAAAHRAARTGGRGDGVVCGHQGGQVDVLTQDYLTVYLSSRAWDGRPRLDVTVS
ncbi:MAG TPA: MiaB/RimO family radical SAM methylthiotransferase [Gemmatimonadales bacterium]|nr:MiaB/RimO family radical SAM methylthiotransferase [Gemmatimonadales bacterium]